MSKPDFGSILNPEDDAPELTEAWLEGATPHQGGEPMSRGGRPRKVDPKRPVSLRLSPDVLDHFRATGRGWQTRIDETLREAMKRA